MLLEKGQELGSGVEEQNVTAKLCPVGGGAGRRGKLCCRGGNPTREDARCSPDERKGGFADLAQTEL